MLTGLNHLTLAVVNLSRSIEFYVALPGFRLAARWETGAYLSLGDLWLCLSLDESRLAEKQPDYTHYAFSVGQEDFEEVTAYLRLRNVIEWKSNSSEGNSFYFSDPDGHRLELHVGSLASRLEQCRRQPYAGMEFFD
ncbi:glutathione transferase [Pseudomonas jessenii]|uniref:Catechol 2,3-dioxygenase n=2 Tax=Pseudomonas TaxID=286 RepID=A0A231FZ09_PSEJE|nr:MULTISPECIES: fosfomycin resistance glutathione transferase [Pseudomonas]OXR29607.1 glutathione transferase [Pseudomonas jessenii]SEC24263.1 Catechol 2,3-dioxygenase [Pseudomonas jessenii]VVP69679.1 Glutathione transferase FosA [Pseudomonas fluorescens]